MADDVTYEAPEITAVAAVNEPLVGLVNSGTYNPQWADEEDVR